MRHAGMLYAGRVCAGVAGGVSCVIAPCYVNEISTPDMSGVLGIIYTVRAVKLFLSDRWIDRYGRRLPTLMSCTLFTNVYI